MQKIIFLGEVIVYPDKEPESVADGIEILVFREFCRRYNMTLNISIVDDGWGDVYPNRSATGLYAGIMADRLDCSCGKNILIKILNEV